MQSLLAAAASPSSTIDFEIAIVLLRDFEGQAFIPKVLEKLLFLELGPAAFQ